MSVQSSTPSATPVQPPAGTRSRGDVLLGFGRRERDDEGRPRVRILWARLARFTAIAIVAGWFILAGLGWAFVHVRQGITSVTYLDIAALPFRWTEYQRKRGDFYIGRGMEMFAAGDYRGAFQMFRIGVQKSPGNLEGRSQLAVMYSSFLRRPEEAVRIFEEGRPPDGGDHAYYQTLLGLLLANQQDERVRSIADERLALTAPETNYARIYALFAAQACFARGFYDAAETYFEKYGLMKTKEGKLLAAQILWERGLRAVATSGVAEVLKAAPNDEQAHALHIAYLRELGQAYNAVEAARRRRAQFPQSIEARISLIQAYQAAGYTEQARAELDSAVAAAAQDQRLVFALADHAAATADMTLADRLGGLAEAAGLPDGSGELIALDVRVAARDYRGALAELERINAEKPVWLSEQGNAIAGMQAVASFGTGDVDMGELYLNKFLGQQSLRVQSLLLIAGRLQAAGAAAPAHRALALAAELEPQNQAVLTRLIEADLAVGATENLPANLERLLATRRPPIDLLQRTVIALGSDRMLFVPGRDEILNKVRAAIDQRGS